MKKILNLCKFVAFVAILITVQKLCYKATEGFTIERIKHPLQEAKHSEPIDPAIGQILERPFRFLASGGQCYAFESEDGQYVLKVFKQHHLRLPSIASAIVPASLNAYFAHKEKTFLASCRIAATELAQETGVVFAHLEKLQGVPSHILLIDKLNISHQVPSSSLPFVLQKRAILFDEHLKMLLTQGKLPEAISAIESVLALAESRCKKGFADNDPVLNRNWGFIGNEAVEVDVGPFYPDPQLFEAGYRQKALLEEFEKFYEQLVWRYPELKDHLDKRMHEFQASSQSSSSHAG